MAADSIVVGAPSISLDAHNRPVIAAFGGDGHLYLRHLEGTDGSWRRIS